MIISNVCVVKYSVKSGREVYCEELGEMFLEELAGKLENGIIKIPKVDTWEQVYVRYKCGVTYYVTVVDKTSDVSAEWFEYSPNEDIVLCSIIDQQNYPRRYTDYLLLNEGKEVMTQMQWVLDERSKSPKHKAIEEARKQMASE